MKETAREFWPKELLYEEGSADTTVYKFHIDIRDSQEWIRVNSGAWYRTTGRRLQFYARESGYSKRWGPPLEAFVRGLDLLVGSHAMELWFGHDEGGYFVRGHDYGEEIVAAPLASLTRASLIVALKQMYSEWSEG